jgi:hypothetical protein
MNPGTLLRYLTLAFLLVLSACASGPPTQAEMASADYGASISQDEAVTKAKQFFARYLKDPFSAQYDWGNVQPDNWRHARIYGGGLVFGYVLQVNVNAKNAFGAYIGFRRYAFVFKNGVIETIYGEQDLSGGATFMGKIY